ncbi:MAG: glycosyltransferase, partial [Crocinitomicaceae bacterium]
WRFYKYIWEERKNYDKVFVHMNQEYVLLAGDMWRLMGKKVYMWRNHAKGDILTMMAVWIAHKVFYTSPQSFTVKFRKSVRMPVGIDTNFFKPDPSVVRESNSILFLGRIAPVKKVLEFVEWLKTQDFDSCTIAGSALAKDLDYEKKVKDRVVELELSDQVKFVGSVNQIEARRLYQTHETYVNFTPVGSLDKTIFEAKACGAKVEVKNSDYEKLSNEDHGLKSLLDKFMVEIK